jgi:hypothetical protein
VAAWLRHEEREDRREDARLARLKASRARVEPEPSAGPDPVEAASVPGGSGPSAAGRGVDEPVGGGVGAG